MPRTLISLAIALALSGAALDASAQPATTRLPRDARPTHYGIEVVPDAERMAFEGKVRISIEVLAPTRSITLNAHGLDIAGARLARANGKDLPARASLDAAARRDCPLPAGGPRGQPLAGHHLVRRAAADRLVMSFSPHAGRRCPKGG